MSRDKLSALVFQHIACEHPGIFRDYLRHDGIRWHTVEFDAGDKIPDLRRYDMLWVMGGPMNVWQESAYPWLRSEKEAIRRWVEADKPYLGICLGHQLLAEAMGGHVGTIAQPVCSVQDVELTPSGSSHPLFAGLERSKCLQWHSAEVIREPPGAIVLASSSKCRVNAMAVTERAFGIQYHPELTPRTVRDWGAIPLYESALGSHRLREMDNTICAAMPEFEAAARKLYDNFMGLLPGTTA